MFSTKSFIECTLKNEGHSLWLGQESYTGYVSAVYGRELVISVDEFKRGATLKNFVECGYNDGYDIIGSWVNDGKVYLDCCRHFDRRNNAENFARANKQLAFYCVDGGYVIDC